MANGITESINRFTQPAVDSLRDTMQAFLPGRTIPPMTRAIQAESKLRRGELDAIYTPGSDIGTEGLAPQGAQTTTAGRSLAPTGHTGISEVTSGAPEGEYGKRSFVGIGQNVPRGTSAPGIGHQRDNAALAFYQGKKDAQRKDRLQGIANTHPSMNMGLNQFFQTAARRGAARTELKTLNKAGIASADRAQELGIESAKIAQKQQEIEQGRFKHVTRDKYSASGMKEGQEVLLYDSRSGQFVQPGGISDGQVGAQAQTLPPGEAYAAAMQETSSMMGSKSEPHIVQNALQKMGVTEFGQKDGIIIGKYNGQWVTFKNGEMVPVNGQQKTR